MKLFKPILIAFALAIASCDSAEVADSQNDTSASEAKIGSLTYSQVYQTAPNVPEVKTGSSLSCGGRTYVYRQPITQYYSTAQNSYYTGLIGNPNYMYNDGNGYNPNANEFTIWCGEDFKDENTPSALRSGTYPYCYAYTHHVGLGWTYSTAFLPPYHYMYYSPIGAGNYWTFNIYGPSSFLDGDGRLFSCYTTGFTPFYLYN